MVQLQEEIKVVAEQIQYFQQLHQQAVVEQEVLVVQVQEDRELVVVLQNQSALVIHLLQHLHKEILVDLVLDYRDLAVVELVLLVQMQEQIN